MSRVAEVLEQAKVGPVIPFDLNKAVVLNFTDTKEGIHNVNFGDIDSFNSFVFSQFEDHDPPVGIGGYNEERNAYSASEHFQTDQGVRSIHLGIDIWAAPGTPITAPFAGKVHSFQNNDHFFDYGPTIILEHTLDGVTFFTLYGHLSPDSIEHLEIGQEISQGQEIARIGQPPTNGNWPPHLHFQIMEDMQGKEGDYPGVALKSEREQYIANCLDPNLILRVDGLKPNN